MKKLLLSLMAASLVLTACEDDFTEKDLLEAQRSAPYSIRVTDATVDQFSDGYAVEGVTVTLTQGGETYTATTNADGFALFAQIKLGEFYYSIEGDKYYHVIGTGWVEDAGIAGFNDISILPKESENFATVTGVVQITNWYGDVIDTLKSGSIEFRYNENTQPIVATVDAEGKFSVSLPARSRGFYYYISASSPLITLGYDQNGNDVIEEGEEGEFMFRSEEIEVISGETIEKFNLSYRLN